MFDSPWDNGWRFDNTYRFKFDQNHWITEDNVRVVYPILYTPFSEWKVYRENETDLGKNLFKEFEPFQGYLYGSRMEQNIERKKMIFDRFFSLGSRYVMIPEPIKKRDSKPNFFNMVETASKLTHA